MYESRLGFSLRAIRESSSRFPGLSYAQIEERLFRDTYRREPTWLDRLKWAWNGRESRKNDLALAKRESQKRYEA